MCGLTGWFKPNFPATVDRTQAAIQLIRRIQTRGEKGFGVVFIKNEQTRYIKYPGPFTEWMEANQKLIKAVAQSELLMAHTRQPTAGSISYRNTHPFLVGSYLCMHNGCISNGDELMLESAYVALGETDSEKAFCWLADNKFSKESFEKVTGSIASTSWNYATNELVLSADSMSDLEYIKTEAGAIWSSDGENIKRALKPLGVETETLYTLKSQIWRLPEDKTEEFKRYGYASTHSKHSSHESSKNELKSRLDSEKDKIVKEIGYDGTLETAYD